MLLLTKFKLTADFLPQRVGVMVASHNEDTVRFTLQQMQKNNIKPEDKVGNHVFWTQMVFVPTGDLLWTTSGHVRQPLLPTGWETDLFERLYREPSSVQAKRASACTSTFRTVPSTRCSPTFPGASNSERQFLFSLVPQPTCCCQVRWGSCLVSVFSIVYCQGELMRTRASLRSLRRRRVCWSASSEIGLVFCRCKKKPWSYDQNDKKMMNKEYEKLKNENGN